MSPHVSPNHVDQPIVTGVGGWEMALELFQRLEIHRHVDTVSVNATLSALERGAAR